MAVPKRKISRTRRGKRRAHQGLEIPGRSLCTNCGEAKAPHEVCPHCGYYKNREVIKAEEE
jgi:large subunit ribosomal protein L32